MLLCSAFLLGGCTKETQTDGGDPRPGDDSIAEVREVMMTLKSQLVLQKGATKANATAATTTKAETSIATAAENAISTLDVYVFGAESENGDYTFLERFAYRADSNDKLPKDAKELQPNTTGADGKETTALMKLKKGLFVKLYCIANDTTLVDPTTDKEVKPKDFTPITFTENEDGTPQLATEGKPLESTFVTWHTRLLTATAKADTLVTPLAMAGAYTTPIDLTSFDNSARIQVGFKLTRLAARFDIDNKAGDSRFTIETVSMGNGRRGSGFFPIRVYGDLPEAKPDQLITYPVHALCGDNANKGLQTGAFYAYPSPAQDKAFLILNGKYKVNETEMKNVSYQIPFMQQAADGTAAWLDIAGNHRYTIAVTKADAYHLDANILVDDWADDGSIEYTPDNKPGEIVVTIPEGFKGDSEYDEDTKIISMSLKDGSTVGLSTTSNAALVLDKRYAGNATAKLYDWLVVSDPVVGTSPNGLASYTYTLSLTKNYTAKRYPKAVLHFMNSTDGSEQVILVEALSVPQPIETTQPTKAPNGKSENPNSFDPETLEANVYRITNSRTQVNITCPDGVELESKPTWLDITKTSQNGAVTTFNFVLNQRDVADTKGKAVFRNLKRNDLKTDVYITLLDAPVTPIYDAIGTDNTHTAAKPDIPNSYDDIQIAIKKDNTATVKATSMDGVTIKIDYPTDSPEWLEHTGTSTTTTKVAASDLLTRAAMSKTEEIKFIPIESKLTGSKTATVTLFNIIGGRDYTFTITPEMLPAEVTKDATSSASLPTQNTLVTDTKKATLYQLPDENASKSQMQLDVYSLGGSKLSIEGDGATVSPAESRDNNHKYILKPALPDGKDMAIVKLHAKNYTDDTKENLYDVTVLRSNVTGDKAVTLTAQKGQTKTSGVTSHEGFTIDPKTVD